MSLNFLLHIFRGSKSGKLIVELNSQVVGLERIGKTIVVGAMDQTLTCYSTKVLVKTNLLRSFFLQVKKQVLTIKTINFLVNSRSRERRRVTESSLRVPLTISSLFTNLVPILRTMTHT